MLTREKLIGMVQNLPETFTIDELIDHLIFMEKVEGSIQQAEQGRVISNDDVKAMIDNWSV
jgi:hypothetical protein